MIGGSVMTKKDFYKEATKDMKSAAVEFNRATRKAAKEFCNEIKRSLKR